MNKLIFLTIAVGFLIVSNDVYSETFDDKKAPTVIGVDLNKSSFLPGEEIEIRVEAFDDDSGLQDGESVGWWLNIDSVEDGRSLKGVNEPQNSRYYKLDDTHYVQKLTLNKWEKPDIYRVNSFWVYDEKMNGTRYAYKEGYENYIIKKGDEIIETELPVLSFLVKPHPKYSPDFTPPIVQSAYLNKSSFSSGEKIALIVEATDDNSGLSDIFHGWAFTARKIGDGVNFLQGNTGSYSKLDDRHCVLTRKIWKSNEPGWYRITNFSVYDSAENRVQLHYTKGFANYMIEEDGNTIETDIPVFIIEILE